MTEKAEYNKKSAALITGNTTYSAAELNQKVNFYADIFTGIGVTRLGIHLDNGVDWIACDLAAQMMNIICVPLPMFFSRGQLEHCCQLAGINAIVTSEPGYIKEVLPDFELVAGDIHDPVLLINKGLVHEKPIFSLNESSGEPEVIGKITFTSGTTGAPKGVLLTRSAIDDVVNSLADALRNVGIERHLCLMPLSVLLENIAGLYLSLKSGATIIAPESGDLGIFGSSGLDNEVLASAINHYQPDSMILLPQLLLTMTDLAEKNRIKIDQFKFLAVGGGRISPNLIERARKAGLPVYEGYGLSECCSVVSLNTPEHNRTGSVGKVLKHQHVSIENNEVVIKGTGFSGYLGDPRTDINNNSLINKIINSGDEGYLDKDGFLFINGRKKNIIVSSFGRNINPEWPESCLLESPYISSAIILGEGKPYLSAIIGALPENTALINQHVEAVNQKLPDYARIRAWHCLHPDQFASKNLLTANGRLKRESVREWAMQECIQSR